MKVDVLVINLTRFGDLLQSQGVIDDLVKAGKRVGLLCQENFAQAAGLMRGLTQVWALPGASLLAALDKSWRKAASRLLEFCNGILLDAEPAFILNLTPTLPARLLCRLLCARGAEPLGFSLDADGYGLNHGVWATFVEVGARDRHNTPFNLADMLRKLGAQLAQPHAGSFSLATPGSAAGAWAEKFLSDHAPANSRGFVAFQLGASEERRRWPVDYFYQLGQWLWKNWNLCPVLVGSAAEKNLAQKYAELAGADAHPFIDAIGATDLAQLSAILRACRLLVTNDTGTMHLAAGLGVPGLAFFLATAQPWDTGPLLSGWCCLEPEQDCHPCAFGKPCGNNFSCNRAIIPDAAISLLDGWLRTGQWSPAAGVRVWQTATSKSGMARIIPLGKCAAEPRSVWLGALREFWEHLLDALASLPEHGQPVYDCEALKTLPAAANIAATLEQSASLLNSISQCGPLLAASPKGGQILLRNCERLQTLLDQCKPLATLAYFWREFRQNQENGVEEFLASCVVICDHVEKLRKAF